MSTDPAGAVEPSSTLVMAPTVAADSTLPRFAVSSAARAWAKEHQIAQRRPGKATLMLVATAAWYAALVALGEAIDAWWGWAIAWIGLVAVMMRIDAIHHEGVHRSLFENRAGNDVVATVTGALEGFHAPIYRCFHLAHHALTRKSSDPSDPEDFYDEMITSPMQVGPITLPARMSYVAGNLLGGITFAVQLAIDAVATMFGRPPGYVRTASLDRYVRRWGLLPFALWGAAIAGAVATGHVGELLRWWVVPMLLFLAGPYTFFALSEHYGAAHDGQMVESTGSVETNAVYRWITLDGNYHLAHHVFPNASWWWLRAADRQLQSDTTLHHDGYLAFHRQVWADMGSTTRSKTTAAPNR
jgi:fatty acid desaturase